MHKNEGLKGCIQGRRKRTTRRNKHAVPAEDLVRREFAAPAPNKLWTADITYVNNTEEGFLYLAFVLDVYSLGGSSVRRWRVTWGQSSGDRRP